MLDNTFYKLTETGKLNIGYFGGSITEGAGASDPGKTCWRALVTDWFRRTYPAAEVTEINAAIGGTGSDLGMYRVEKDLLTKKPDLVFIEFAVNDSGMAYEAVLEQAETLCRKILTADPMTDMVCVITTTKAISDRLNAGGEYTSRSAHEAAAHRYGMPVIEMGEVLRYEIGCCGGDFLRFTTDTVHPNDAGYRLYGDCVITRLEQWARNAEKRLTEHEMPVPLSEKTYESAAMTDCDAMEGFRSAGFGKTDLSLCGRYSGYLEAREPGAFFTFRFTGTRLGFYGMLAADSGDMLVSVDGGPEKTVRMWDTYCLSFSRAGGFFAETDLPEGCHTVTVRAAETKAEQSEGHAIRISAVLTA